MKREREGLLQWTVNSMRFPDRFCNRMPTVHDSRYNSSQPEVLRWEELHVETERSCLWIRQAVTKDLTSSYNIQSSTGIPQDKTAIFHRLVEFQRLTTSTQRVNLYSSHTVNSLCFVWLVERFMNVRTYKPGLQGELPDPTDDSNSKKLDQELLLQKILFHSLSTFMKLY